MHPKLFIQAILIVSILCIALPIINYKYKHAIISDTLIPMLSAALGVMSLIHSRYDINEKNYV